MNGKTLYILPEETFKKIELPVLARNKLDNGISKNLWYEQVVPHESLGSVWGQCFHWIWSLQGFGEGGITI